MTLGPVGTVAHPPKPSTPTNTRKPRAQFIVPSPLLLRRSCLWYHLHPPARAALDVWVVTWRILAVVPILGLLLSRVGILLRLLLDRHRWSGIVVWVVRIPRVPWLPRPQD